MRAIRNKSLIAAGTCSLVLLVLFLSYGVMSVYRSTRTLQVPETIDVGTVEAGTVAQADVRIRNCLSKPVRLYGFGRGCGCVDLLRLADGQPEPVGEVTVPSSADLVLRLRFVAYGGQAGDFHHQFWFQTDLPECPQFVVSVIGNVWAPMIVLPKELNVGRITRGTSTATYVRLVDCRAPNERKPFKVICDDSQVRFGQPMRTNEPIDLEDLPEGATVFRVPVCVGIANDASSIRTEYQVIDDDGNLLCRSQVLGTVYHSVELVPSTFTLPRIGAASPYSFRSVCRADMPCEIIPERIPEGFAVHVHSTTIEVNCRSTSPPEGTSELAFKAKTSDGKMHPLTLRVTIYRPAAGERDAERRHPVEAGREQP